MSDSKFWEKAHAVAAKATWAYLATAAGDQPKVRVVHPAFEGERVWVATGRGSAKARHIDKNANVELFYQIGADMVHLTVTGKAKFVEDVAEKKRVWNGKVFDYDLSQFWPGGPESKNSGLSRFHPRRGRWRPLPEIRTGRNPGGGR